MPELTAFHVFAVDLPFRVPFRHALAERRTSGSVFVRASLSTGAEGWGECLPRPYVSGETQEASFALLRDVILPAMVGRNFRNFDDVTCFLEECDGKAPPACLDPATPQSAAWCSFELALIDVFGKEFGQPAALRPGTPGERKCNRPGGVRYSGVISAGRGWSYVTSLLAARAYGFPDVKVKLQGDSPLSHTVLARRLLGPGADIRVDANTGWEVEQALHAIDALRGLGIQAFEQPIAADDMAGLARLVRESSADIIADEGFTDRRSLERLLAGRACTGVNVRISKCGGLVASYARARQALDAALLLQVGCQVGESSLLSAAHVILLDALAPLTPGVRYAEGCFGRRLLREDPVSPNVQFRYGGRPPRRPANPGLGVSVDQAKLRRWAEDDAVVT